MKNTLCLFVLCFCITKTFAQGIVDVDGNQYDTVIIGQQIWITANLNVMHYNNGDTIMEARTTEEWIKCSNNKIGCWCNYNNDPDDTDAASLNANVEPRSFGKLYNWYALTDLRGLTIKGYHIPSCTEWNSLIPYGANSLKSRSGWQKLDNDIFYKGCNCTGLDCNGNDSARLNIKPGGYRLIVGLYNDPAGFYERHQRAIFWARSYSAKKREMQLRVIGGMKIKEEGAINIFQIDSYGEEPISNCTGTFGFKGDGYSVRLIKNKKH